MKSYLISALAHRFSSAELDAFIKVHAHDWLLWEPGAWKPPGPTTLVANDKPPTSNPANPASGTPAPNRAGEALALALELKKDGGQLTLGRGNECDAVINDGTLSQLHLVFMKTPHGAWTVRDANSRNGSSVDGAKLIAGKPVELKNGARVFAAQVAFTFYTPQGMLQRIKQP